MIEETFDAQMTNLQTMQGISEESLQTLRDDILAMAEPETPGMFDIPLPVVDELDTWERLLHSRFQSCYYRTNWGAPGDPEWVPAHVVSVQGAWKTRVRVEIQPDRGTDFADAFYRALDYPGGIGRRQSTIVIRDLSELHLLNS